MTSDLGGSASREGAIRLRVPTGAEREATERLARSAVEGRWWAELAETALRLAFGESASREAWALVAPDDDSGGVRAVAVVGFVAGAVGTARVHLVAVAAAHRGRTEGRAVVARAVAHLRLRGARLVVAELPDDGSDAALAAGRRVLERCGFVEVARVRDLYRDGVDLVVMRHEPESR